MDKVENVLKSLFFSFEEGNQKVEGYIAVFKNWRKIVGDERLAEHSRLEEIEGNRIRISFDHPGWIQKFKIKEFQILERIQSYIPHLLIKSTILHLRDERIELPKESKEEKKVISKERNHSDISQIKNSELKELLENLKSKINDQY